MVKKTIKWVILIVFLTLLIGKVMILTINDGNDTEEYAAIKADNVCVALNYHRIKKSTPLNKTLEKLTKTQELTTFNVYQDEFEKQLDYLIEEGAYFATLDDLVRFKETGIYPEKCVWISFDDVDESVYKNAYPLLKERNIPFTLFVIAGKVGENDFNNLKMATWDQLREMKDSGLASFGSHTFDMHYFEGDGAIFLLPKLYPSFEEDIKKSKEVLQRELGIEITTIAYPFGNTNDSLNKIARTAGFKQAFILSPSPITSNTDTYYQNRYVCSTSVFDKVIIPWLQR